MAAAVKAGSLAKQRGLPVRILLLEADDRVGRSILRTGNGRCNFSNAYAQQGDYRNKAFVARAFVQLSQLEGHEGDSVLRFFEDWGLSWAEESEGRLYPVTNKATTVLNVLRSACQHLGVEERCECQVVAVDPPHDAGAPFTLRMDDGQFLRAQAVIVACGGAAARSLVPDAPFQPLHPVLGPLEARLEMPGLATGKKAKQQAENPLLALNNIRVACKVALACQSAGGHYEEAGELLFRKYGVSGIAVFNLSRYAQPGDKLTIDLLPDWNQQETESNLFARRRRLASSYDGVLTWEDMLRGLVLPPVAQLVAALANARLQDAFLKQNVTQLAAVLKGIPLVVQGIHDQEGQCQVRQGGFLVEAFDAKTCQLASCPGLYVVGEALDVDAPCGGYNLYWAWSSGMLAAHSVAARMLQAEGRGQTPKGCL